MARKAAPFEPSEPRGCPAFVKQLPKQVPRDPRFWPRLSKFAPDLADVGQSVGRCRPTLADVGHVLPIWPESNRMLAAADQADVGQAGPSLADFGRPNPAQICQARPESRRMEQLYGICSTSQAQRHVSQVHAETIEGNDTARNLATSAPCGEPRSIAPAATALHGASSEMALIWSLNGPHGRSARPSHNGPT